MTCVQKTLGVLVGVVFCLGLYVPHTVAAREPGCYCATTENGEKMLIPEISDTGICNGNRFASINIPPAYVGDVFLYGCEREVAQTPVSVPTKCECIVSYNNYHSNATECRSTTPLKVFVSHNQTVQDVLLSYKGQEGACRVEQYGSMEVNYNARTDSFSQVYACSTPLGRMLTPIAGDGEVSGVSTVLDEQNCNGFHKVVRHGKAFIVGVHDSVATSFMVSAPNNNVCVSDDWQLSIGCSKVPEDLKEENITHKLNDPGYEPIAWSFPIEKINELNKVGGISGDGTTQVQLLIGRLIKYAVGFLGALALCLVIYSGLRFMLSQGDEGKQEESLKMMLWAGIGIVALLGSYSMVTFVLSILN